MCINYIDLLSHLLPTNGAINNLNDALAYDIINKSEDSKIASILPVLSEIYLIDTHATNSALGENLVVFNLQYIRVLQENNWFLTISQIFTYFSYKGLAQVILTLRIVDNVKDEQLVHSVSFGLNLGDDFTFFWVDFSPSIYYKGSYIIFEKDYQESGNFDDSYEVGKCKQLSMIRKLLMNKKA